jgi:hypothetical protein
VVSKGIEPDIFIHREGSLILKEAASEETVNLEAIDHVYFLSFQCLGTAGS